MSDNPPRLINFGVLCYLNSGIQAISACPRFIEGIDDLLKNYKSEKLKLFNTLLHKMNEGDFRDNISKNKIFEEWTKPGQQDSFELLAHVINQVYDEMRKEKEENGTLQIRNLQEWLKVKLPMRMNMKYEIQCECKYTDQTPFQSEIALHVSFPQRQENIQSYFSNSIHVLVPKRQNLQLHDMLSQYFDKDKIEDFECGRSGCSKKVAWRTLKLYNPLPDTFCIHLQRLYWNGRRMEKINDEVLFSNRITLKKEYLKSFKEESKSKSEELIKQEGEEIVRKMEGSSSPNEDESGEIIQIKTPCNKIIDNEAQSSNLNIKEFKSRDQDQDQNEIIYALEKGPKNYIKKDADKDNESDLDLSDLMQSYEMISLNKNEDKKGAPKMNPNKSQSSSSCGSESKNNDINESKNVKDKIEISESERNDDITQVHGVDVYQGKNTGKKENNDKLLKNNKGSDKDNESGGLSDVHYYLKSVIVHSGGESSGHYVCYKKCNGRWYYTSDTYVKEVNFEEVFSCNPYILFYEKSDFEEICPTIIKMNYNINIIIHALAACSVFINWLNEVKSFNGSKIIKSLLYLINFVNGNVTKSEELINISDWCKEEDILSILQSILKQIDSLSKNENDPVPMKIILDKVKYESNKVKPLLFYTTMNLEISHKNNEDSIQDIFEENFGNDHLNYSSQIQKFRFPLPKMMCLNLKKVDGEKVLRKFSLRDKLILKPLYIAIENREGVKDTEYYLKSVISQGRCYRNINGSWICVNYDNFKVYNAEYVWIDDPCIMFYDSSPLKEIKNKEFSSLVNYNNFTKKIVISPPKIITINDYLNSFIQALSSCLIFTEELIKIYDESLVKLEHLLNLIYYANGNIQEIENTFEYVKRYWSKDVLDFDQFMNRLLTDIFFFLRENKDIPKIDPLRCHYVRRVSCSCGHSVWSPEEVYFCLNVSTTQTDSSLQDMVDFFCSNKNIDGKVCYNEHCSEKNGEQSIKLCLPLSKTICIKVSSNHKFSFSDIITIKKENSIKNNDYNLVLTRDEVYNLKSLITDSGRCCYRKVDDTWYKVTGKSSEMSSENAVFACTPHHLFYESLGLVTCDKPLRGIIHALSSSSSFVKWLKEVNDNNIMNKVKYLYKRISMVDDNVLNEDLLIEGVGYKWNTCCTPDYYKLLKTVLEDIMEELKKNPDNDKSHIPLIILNIQSHNATSNKSPLIIDIEYNRDNLLPERKSSEKIKLQQLWNEKFDFFSCINSTTERLHLKIKKDISIVVLKEPFPSTFIINITKGLSISILLRLIMKSAFCLPCSEDKESPEICCCKQYLLKTIIDINNKCYTLENNKWRIVNDSDQKKVEIKSVENLSPSILFYEEMQTKVERI